MTWHTPFRFQLPFPEAWHLLFFPVNFSRTAKVLSSSLARRSSRKSFQTGYFYVAQVTTHPTTSSCRYILEIFCTKRFQGPTYHRDAQTLQNGWCQEGHIYELFFLHISIQKNRGTLCYKMSKKAAKQVQKKELYGKEIVICEIVVTCSHLAARCTVGPNNVKN